MAWMMWLACQRTTHTTITVGSMILIFPSHMTANSHMTNLTHLITILHTIITVLMTMMDSMTTTMIMVMPVAMVVMIRIKVVTDIVVMAIRVAICMLMISPHKNKRRSKERILELKNRVNSQKSNKKLVRRLLQRKSKSWRDCQMLKRKQKCQKDKKCQDNYRRRSHKCKIELKCLQKRKRLLWAVNQLILLKPNLCWTRNHQLFLLPRKRLRLQRRNKHQSNRRLSKLRRLARLLPHKLRIIRSSRSLMNRLINLISI